MATNGNINHDQYAAPAQTTETPTNAEAQANNLPKDEVGWYFVEQYYTTMSRSPDRLHLYYGKKAQFVCGRETEVVDISFGRQAIQERIKSQDFQDCKVRVTNVDTQGSEDNILIAVIGEMANKEDETKKFVQTFVLAQQPSGYFVLNDMLRFLNDDVEEETEAAADEQSGRVDMPAGPESEEKAEAPAAEEAVPEEAPVSTEAAAEKQEETKEETPAAAAPSTTEPPAETQEAPSEAAQAQTDVEKTVEEIAEEDVEKPEEPKDPAPTPSAAPALAQPEKAKEPPKPMSWASRVAAAAGPSRPVAPAVPKTATPPAPAQARAAAPAASQPAAPASQSQESAAAPAASKDQGSEWQTAETKRQSRAQPAAATGSEKEGVMAYIKYVTEKVEEKDLRAALSSFGELAYFDINRSKNCAFVEFKTQAGYNAAIKANPLTVNGENVVVEQRRPKANAYGGSNYNASRGGAGRGGRGGYEPSRSGSQGGGRGGFGQSRGRGGGSRGRGGSQVGTA
ncbi:uncharacterized protein P884DRAFT_189188 [Thermothelomyces heterothallicus CBS 202.75]|uniref:uncharacterized protein n=1 Tax=Thermothelomyces heterothallicus CBS 202.75 TaxID=1149848 RepID=UPI0037449972